MLFTTLKREQKFEQKKFIDSFVVVFENRDKIDVLKQLIRKI
jgi:hypothetical protein